MQDECRVSFLRGELLLFVKSVRLGAEELRTQLLSAANPIDEDRTMDE
jgi:hypothetical protein